MKNFSIIIDFYKNSALAFDMLDHSGHVTAKNEAEAREIIAQHCKQWGYNYKLKSIKAEG